MLILPKLMGVPLAALALVWKPTPGVLKTTPRGDVVLKKFAGRLLGAEDASGTPSQLISRRSPPKEPLAPAVVPPPKSPRKASRAATRVGSAAVRAEALRTTVEGRRSWALISPLGEVPV